VTRFGQSIFLFDPPPNDFARLKIRCVARIGEVFATVFLNSSLTVRGSQVEFMDWFEEIYSATKIEIK
jgi:hypothetical protein